MNNLFTTRNIALMAMLGALAGVLMILDFPLLFVAPSFYKLDLGEVPVLVGAFIMGPAAGVVTELIKIVVKLLLKPTSTGMVGELANVVIGIAQVLPAGIIYRRGKTKRRAVAGLILGTLVMSAVGVAVNATVMIPFYARLMPLDTILSMGAAIHPSIGSVWGFALLIVGPFNLIKGALTSLITFLIYKRLSRPLHNFIS